MIKKSTKNPTKLEIRQQIYEDLGYHFHIGYPGRRVILMVPGKTHFITIFKNGKVKTGKHELK